jgi:hypothetical protein
MSDLVDFLLARITEDEARPRGFGAIAMEVDAEGSPTGRLLVPARILAECEAKRRVVELYLEARRSYEWDRNDTGFAAEAWAYEAVVKQLALPHADHPDYREEWRP